MDKDFYQYYEDMLRAQYRASEAIVRKAHLARGTIREDFLRDVLLCSRDSLNARKGFLKIGSNASNECDLLFYDHNAPAHSLGDHVFLEPKHCRLVLEVKSNATSADLEKTEKNFETINNLDRENPPLCGLFCFNIAISKKTVLQRFGFDYDEELDQWRNNSFPEKYPHIDFMICIAASEQDDECAEYQFFVMKHKPTGEYILAAEIPIMENLFTITDNI